MKKVILSMMVSLDGYVQGLNRDINWHVWDEEMEAYMLAFFSTVDTFLYGRVSYELMLKYWPSEAGEFAAIMNNTPKIVFSRTLNKVEWNSRLIKENIPEEIAKLKSNGSVKDKDMVLFAGADIASEFIQHNLIDEYRLIVNPVVLGSGTPLFKNLRDQLHLKHVKTQSFNCGNVILHYTPQK